MNVYPRIRFCCVHFLVRLLPVLTLAVTPAAGGETVVFTLRELLGKEWRREWVSFAVDVQPGVLRPASLSLTGPDGEASVQLSDVESWPDDGGIRSARVHFIVDELGALDDRRYTLRSGAEPAEPPPASGALSIQREPDTVIIDTGLVAVRMALGGQSRETPMDPADVPGPLDAMRLADGDWFGTSLLYGETPLRAWSSKVTAAGPVFAEVTTRYEYVDGNRVMFRARVVAGDSAVYWDMDVAEDRPGEGLQFVLNRGLPPLTFRFPAESSTRRPQLAGRGLRLGAMVELPLAEMAPGPLTRLTPWNDWWDDTTQTEIVFTIEGRDTALSLAARGAGDWVEPAPAGTWRQWTPWQHKLAPLFKTDDGDVVMHANYAAGDAGGVRRWIMTGRPLATLSEAGRGYWTLGGRVSGVVGRYLNTVKDRTLEWEGDQGTHPRLFVSRDDIAAYRDRVDATPAEIRALSQHGAGIPRVPHTFSDSSAVRAWLLSGSDEIAEQARLVERLKHHLGLLGHYDRMRLAALVVSLYDAIIDSVPMRAGDRRVCQARLAYLGYVIASPENWSMERGYRSGNLNMSIAHILTLGLLAAAIPEHPMAMAWSEGALVMMDRWLDNHVGPAGEFLGAGESQANYAPVSVAKMLTYAIAAERAGFRNYIDDPRMRRLMTFMAQQQTPPDPRFPSDDGVAWRRTPASGRGPRGQTHGLYGLMARATRDANPAYSAVMQWAWKQSGRSASGFRDRMAGLETVYMDPTLFAAAPDWDMDVFPSMGAIMRHGVGAKDEWYIHFLLEPRQLTAYGSESGGFPGIWAFGVPISVRFGGRGYAEREELLISRVLPARNVGAKSDRLPRFQHVGANRMIETVALPSMHYLSAELLMDRPAEGHLGELVDLPAWPAVEQEAGFPIRWHRRVLFVRGTASDDVNYLAVHDTVHGNQPTMWQFWTLSETLSESGIPPPDAPGDQAVDARPLDGDRFTATGQLGVDVEFYVAEPRDTPRYTLRWGTDPYHIPANHTEYQDLLHLQRSDDGAYYVVIFPRQRHVSAPRFERLGNGAIVRVAGDFGVDYLFLSDPATTDGDGDVFFEGAVAMIQDRAGGRVLSLGAAGTVAYGALSLTADGAAGVTVTRDHLDIALPPDAGDRTLRLRVPEPNRLVAETAGIALDGGGADWTVRIPAGITHGHLTR